MEQPRSLAYHQAQIYSDQAVLLSIPPSTQCNSLFAVGGIVTGLQRSQPKTRSCGSEADVDVAVRARSDADVAIILADLKVAADTEVTDHHIDLPGVLYDYRHRGTLGTDSTNLLVRECQTRSERGRRVHPVTVDGNRIEVAALPCTGYPPVGSRAGSE